MDDFEKAKAELQELLKPFTDENYHLENIKLARLRNPLLYLPDDVDKEIWKKLKSDKYLQNTYLVSSWGRVFNKVGNFFPKMRIDEKGYLVIGIDTHYDNWKDGNGFRSTSVRVHRLVAMTFIDNPQQKETVNHKDLNKLNNLVSNLEWMTNEENVKHAYDNEARNSRGYKYFTREEINEIRTKHQNGVMISVLAREYSKDVKTISNIVNHVSYKDDFWDTLGFTKEQVRIYKTQIKNRKNNQ